MAVDLQTVFRTLKGLLRPYARELDVKSDDERRYELEGTKSAVVAGRKRASVYFAGAIIQKHYVGLYFMPVYSHPDEFVHLPERIRKMLKGKSCFYVKDIEPETIEALSEMLAQGFDLYRAEGWI